MTIHPIPGERSKASAGDNEADDRDDYEDEADEDAEDEEDNESDMDEDDDSSDGDGGGDGSDEEKNSTTGKKDENDPSVSDPPRRPRARTEPRTRARGPGGLGRPSTGPSIRYRDEPMVLTDSAEVVPNIAQWPGTAEAARMAGRHTSTIKLWRTQGRIRAIQDESGCWRYHPDDLAETVDAPDGTDPGTVLAQGMSAIVGQGAAANERLIAMTALATDGLKDTAAVLSTELERAYRKIAALEEELQKLRALHGTERAAELKHDRFIRRLELSHERDVLSARETSARMAELLSVVGPIAASIGHRVLGNVAAAEQAEQTFSAPGVVIPGGAVSSGAPGAAPPPTPPSDTLPIEARITRAMARLCEVVRTLDERAFVGLRAMLPSAVQTALDAIRTGGDDTTVGRALAVLVGAAQKLSDLQFSTLRPLAPSDVAAVLTELRELLRAEQVTITPDDDEGP